MVPSQTIDFECFTLYYVPLKKLHLQVIKFPITHPQTIYEASLLSWEKDMIMMMKDLIA